MVTKMYKVEGMSCSGCMDTVKSALKGIPGVIEAIVRLEAPQAIVSMQQTVPLAEIAGVVSASGNYRVEEWADPEATASQMPAEHSGGKKIWKIFGHKKDCCKP
jgi:copper chaperone CopZ